MFVYSIKVTGIQNKIKPLNKNKKHTQTYFIYLNRILFFERTIPLTLLDQSVWRGKTYVYLPYQEMEDADKRCCIRHAYHFVIACRHLVVAW